MYGYQLLLKVLHYVNEGEKTTRQVVNVLAKDSGLIYNRNLHQRTLRTLKTLEKHQQIEHYTIKSKSNTQEYVWKVKRSD